MISREYVISYLSYELSLPVSTVKSWKFSFEMVKDQEMDGYLLQINFEDGCVPNHRAIESLDGRTILRRPWPEV